MGTTSISSIKMLPLFIALGHIVVTISITNSFKYAYVFDRTLYWYE